MSVSSRAPKRPVMAGSRRSCRAGRFMPLYHHLFCCCCDTLYQTWHIRPTAAAQRQRPDLPPRPPWLQASYMVSASRSLAIHGTSTLCVNTVDPHTCTALESESCSPCATPGCHLSVNGSRPAEPTLVVYSLNTLQLLRRAASLDWARSEGRGARAARLSDRSN